MNQPDIRFSFESDVISVYVLQEMIIVTVSQQGRQKALQTRLRNVCEHAAKPIQARDMQPRRPDAINAGASTTRKHLEMGSRMSNDGLDF